MKLNFIHCIRNQFYCSLKNEPRSPGTLAGTSPFGQIVQVLLFIQSAVYIIFIFEKTHKIHHKSLYNFSSQ